MSEWTPSKSDVEWTKNLISRLSTPGIWAMDAGVISINKKDKTFKVMATTGADIGTIDRCIRVLEGSLGYTLIKADSVIASCVGDPSSWFSKHLHDKK